MWFRRFEARLEHEKQSVESLVAEGIVKRVEWNVSEAGGTVYADVDFEAGGQIRESKLVYPFVFPYAPLQVRPRLEGERWSSHQWRSGELCLEIRADNWLPEFSARDMLLSACKLLDTEATFDDLGRSMQVFSDHQITEVQQLGAHSFWLVISDELIEAAKQKGADQNIIDLTTTVHENSWVFTAVSLGAAVDTDKWLDPNVPAHLRSNASLHGRIAVLETGDARHSVLSNTESLSASVWAEFSDIPFDGSGIVVGLLDGRTIAKLLLRENVIEIAKVPMDTQQRSPTRNDDVKGKRVAIVGCGSMGSKVAASLARCGVSDFFLVDGDVLKPANLVRNDLDWTAVGAYKVDGVIKRLRSINPDVQIESWRGMLGGQDSTASLIGCLEKLGKCDLIVETTGSGQGFAFAAAVAIEKEVPMIWGRVFGGGYGGYLVRCRPGIEAPPFDVRHDIYMQMADASFPAPPADSEIDYGSEADDQITMIADDADVSIISAHLARFALDGLRPPESSDYPNSAYLIGLRKEWAFDEPFQTFPLILRSARAAQISHGLSSAQEVQVGASADVENYPYRPTA